MTTISTKSGKVIKVVSSEEEKTTLTVLFCKLNDAPVVTLNDAVTV